MQNISAEIIVVDNHSSDGSAGYLPERFPQVNFIWSLTNDGFGKANNVGLRYASGQNILFLNPDTIVPEDCLEKCLAFLGSNPSIGALGIKMVDGSGQYLKESKRGFPSTLTSLFKLSGLTKLFPRSPIFARYYLGHLDSTSNHQVDVLAGAFMMIRKELLDKLCGFDEDFFMYGEDIDLSYRIQKAGYKNYYFAESIIIHFKGESTQKSSPQYSRNFYGTMGLFVKKHYSKKSAVLYQPLVNLAITFNQMRGRVGQFFIKEEQEENPFNFLVVGDKTAFESVQTILQNAPLISDAVHVDTGNESMELSAGVSRFFSIIYNYPHHDIIFCANGLAIKNIIFIICQLPRERHFYFHLPGSHCIVGSDDKNGKGKYFSARDTLTG